MTESDSRFLQRLRDEADRVLGPGIDVREIAAVRVGRRTRLTATCETSIGAWSIEAEGPSLVAASGRLLARLPEERLAVAFRRMLSPQPVTGG